MILIKIGIIGGDKREEYLVNLLAKKGFELRVLKKSTDRSEKSVKYFQKIKDVVGDVEVVLAPMSGTDEDGFLKSVFVDYKVNLDSTFFSYFKPGTFFMIGVARTELKELLKKENIKYLELAELDDVAILNAIPTAEGALKIAIEETDYTIYGSNTLVLGLGRVGLTMAWRLRQLGAKSYAVTRDRAAMARGKDLGIDIITYERLRDYLPQMDILFNTVPAQVLTEEYINLLKDNSLIIDLASTPGGTDFKAAEKMGIKALLAPGLPGKIAPRTAAEILADVIPGLIKEKIGV